MAPPFRPWADLNTELLLLIADSLLSLRDYLSLRGVCTAWRAASSLFPCLLVLHDVRHYDGASLPRHEVRATAVSVPMRRTFRLPTLPCHSSCIISSGKGGYRAVIKDSLLRDPFGIFLLNPLTGQEIELAPLTSAGYPRKIVWGANPRPDDYTVVAICYHHYRSRSKVVAYTKAGGKKWTFIDIDGDVATHWEGWPAGLAYDAEDGDGGKVYYLDELGGVRVLHIPRGRTPQKAVVEPLLPADHRGGAGPPFDPAAVFTPPYDILCKRTYIKDVFLCDGILYQVWQNIGAAMNHLRSPAGGVFTVSKNQMFFLRYYPGGWPCWDVVKDLGGYSVFIGRDSPAVVRAEAVPGVRPHCVYWIDDMLCGEPCVFDMATGTSTRCAFPYDVGTARCWYFNSDNVTSIDRQQNGVSLERTGDN